MAQYRAKPIIVDALRIEDVGSIDGNGIVTLTLENGQVVHASSGMTARYTPKSGDYWVTQPDGYVYLNPKAVFESKYEKLQSEKPRTPIQD